MADEYTVLRILDMGRNSSEASSAAEEAEDTDLRIVLLGKTGAGKSSAGNTILGGKAFQPALSTSSEGQRGQFEGQRLTVVDTPGLLNIRLTEEEVKREITKCFLLAAPGPHVFLFVIRAGRFTEEEREAVKIIQKVFGPKSTRYTLVLFTHGDDVEADGDTIDKIIRENPALCSFISRCGGRYHVFTNRDRDPSQVRELLKKINTMVMRNGGSCYTTEMLKEAERSQFQVLPAAVGAAVVGGIGAGVGAAGGLVGVAVGAAVGVTAGAIMGLKLAAVCNKR